MICPKCEELKERIRQLEAAFSSNASRYVALGLTQRRADLLAILMRHSVLTKELAIALAPDEIDPLNNLFSLLRWLRKALPQIEFTTVRGVGIYLATKEKRKVEELLADAERSANGAHTALARSARDEGKEHVFPYFG